MPRATAAHQNGTDDAREDPEAVGPLVLYHERLVDLNWPAGACVERGRSCERRRWVWRLAAIVESCARGGGRDSIKFPCSFHCLRVLSLLDGLEIPD